MTSHLSVRFLMLAALIVTGCSSPSGTSDAQAAQGARTAPHAAQPHGLITATLTDPAMNGMAAQTMTVPAGWKTQGIVMISPCTDLPRAVYRAYAPDGLTEMRLTPAIAWTWSPNPRVPRAAGCLPFSGPMSAADFLGKYLETLPGGVHVVGMMPVNAAYRNAAAAITAGFMTSSGSAQRAGGPIPIRFTDDEAAIHVQTHNGTFLIDQRLRTTVRCEIHDTGMMAGGKCSAQVEILRAPQGKLEALIQLVDANNLPDPEGTTQWRQAEMQIIYKQGQDAQKRLSDMFVAGTRAQKQMFDNFMQTTQRNHQAFMAQQESSFQSSMNNAQASQNARQTAASDVVDYALDQQTVNGQGGLAKVSSAYTQTWSSTVGNQTTWYQTNDPNASPQGVLPGNWTADTKVHGNGQPY